MSSGVWSLGPEFWCFAAGFRLDFLIYMSHHIVMFHILAHSDSLAVCSCVLDHAARARRAG